MRRSGDAVQTSPHRYLYDLWKHLLRRCTNPQDRQWHNYGGRGIQVHPAWLDDYAAFKAYILSELGERPSSDGPRSKWSLDRIDNDGNYEPGIYDGRWLAPNYSTAAWRVRITTSCALVLAGVTLGVSNGMA